MLRRADVVLAMSPPLTLGLTGWLAGVLHRAPLVYSIQRLFPDEAIEAGAITSRPIITVARWLERLSYRNAAAVTVLSVAIRGNVPQRSAPKTGVGST